MRRSSQFYILFMPGLDWNWFFSSLAQSSATVVGLFAAFMVSKIISSEQQFSRKNRDMKSLLETSQELATSAQAYDYGYYLANVSAYLKAKLALHLDRSDDAVDIQRFVRESTLPFLGDPSALVAEIEKHHRNLLEQKKQSRLLPYNHGLLSEFNAKTSGIRQLCEDIEANRRELNSFVLLIEGNPEYSKLVSCCISIMLVLFVMGFTIPLLCLPYDLGGTVVQSMALSFTRMQFPKACIILGSTVIFLLMMVSFLVLNERFKYPKTVIAELRGRCAAEYYFRSRRGGTSGKEPV